MDRNNTPENKEGEGIGNGVEWGGNEGLAELILEQLKRQEAMVRAVCMGRESVVAESVGGQVGYDGYFQGHYIVWRDRRVAAIIEHYGHMWLQGKKVLEVGCGYGDIGLNFKVIGAEVTFSEARREHVEVLKQRYPNNLVVEANLENEWPFLERYDLILHLGVLYHLDNFEFSLRSALKCGDHVVLETEVCDSLDPYKVIKVEEDREGYDQSYIGVGSRPSTAYIERVLKECGCEFSRIEDNRCNAAFHIYNWKEGGTDNWGSGMRRLWFIRTKR